MIAASDVTVRAGRAVLLDRVSASAAPGQILAVIGPNGAGKSTLLRVLAGEHLPDDGEARLAGRALDDWTWRELARVRAVVSQETTLDFPFTTLEVVLMGRTPHIDRVERASDRRIAAWALEAVGLAAFADRLYSTLSGGEKQRTQFARALAQVWQPASSHSGRCLLLDEPTASLDLAHQYEVLRLARCFAAQGGTVIAIVHDLNLVAAYADQVVLLRAGRVIDHGTPAEVLTATNVHEAFGIPAAVLPHPCLPVPLIVPLSRAVEDPEPIQVVRGHND